MTIFRIGKDELTKASGQYVVERGDSFSKIAQREYKNMKLWPVLWAYNRRDNPNVLREGETIVIPKIFGRNDVPQELIFLAERVWNRL